MKIIKIAIYAVAASVSGLSLAETASEQLDMIGKCLAINSQYAQKFGSMPAKNLEYINKWDKARTAVLDAAKMVEQCRSKGGSQDACINQLPSGLQFLMKGFVAGGTAFNKAYINNDKGQINLYLIACAEK